MGISIEMFKFYEVGGKIRDVDCTDMEEFYEDDDYLSPQENGGRATHEIYSAKDDVLLYSNKNECTSLMGEMEL